MATPADIPNPGPSFTDPNVYIGVVPYADKTFANAYFAERMDSDDWDNADDPTKVKALKSATRWIDYIPWVGRKTDPFQKQEWPREGRLDLPLEISEGTCEVALEILRGNTLEKMLEKVGISSESIGSTSTAYESGGASRLLELNHGLPSAAAARILACWMDDSDVIRMERVS